VMSHGGSHQARGKPDEPQPDGFFGAWEEGTQPKVPSEHRRLTHMLYYTEIAGRDDPVFCSAMETLQCDHGGGRHLVAPMGTQG
jgi:hypothetical protein